MSPSSDPAPLHRRMMRWVINPPTLLVAGYLLLSFGLLLLIGHSVYATIAAGLFMILGIGSARLLRPWWFTYSPQPPKPSLPGVSSGYRRFWGLVSLTAVLCFFTGQALAQSVRLSIGSASFENHNQMLNSTPVVWLLLFTLVIAPASEEFLLRGALYPLLRHKLSFWVSIAITTLLFSVLHANIVQGLLTIPLAVLLAIAYENTRKLWPMVAIHAGFNLLSVIVPAALINSMATVPITLCLTMITIAALAYLAGQRNPVHRAYLASLTLR